MYLANMTTAREIWTEILQHGNGNKANSWMEYLRLERFVSSDSQFHLYHVSVPQVDLLATSNKNGNYRDSRNNAAFGI